MAKVTANEIDNNLKNLFENFEKDNFLYGFLEVYGFPKTTITHLKKGTNQLGEKPGQSIIKNKLCFQEVSDEDLHAELTALESTKAIKTNKVRFIIVTNYSELIAKDLKTLETKDIHFNDLPAHAAFFFPLAGMEKATQYSDSPADKKAAEKMAKLFDQIERDNPDFREQYNHDLNHFFARILFCYFAEDTGVFKKGIFTQLMSGSTQDDGSDLSLFFAQAFKIMNLESKDATRHKYPSYMQDFPYVNGGLFKDEITLPHFTKKTHDVLIECGHLNWSEINPDIFGSMFQGVMKHEERDATNSHYTSVPNIQKVIDPLFLNALKNEAQNITRRLYELKDKAAIKKAQKEAYEFLERLGKIKFFDPACGSGNFLVITYKELRRIEINIFKAVEDSKRGAPRLNFMENKKQQMDFHLERYVSVNQFYGIELKDFAQEIAKLSLWLAEHQMNLEFEKVLGVRTNSILPLNDGANIILGNATRINWQEVCSNNNNEEVYLFGNPPFAGSNKKTLSEKSDLEFVFKNIVKEYNNLDYVSCWFYLGAQYIKNTSTPLAFVSTNSITQGQQVALLWPFILKEELGLEIPFAHTSFKWTNNAKGSAGVTCVIIGLAAQNDKPKYIYTNNIADEAKHITPYLTKAPDIYVQKQHTPP